MKYQSLYGFYWFGTCLRYLQDAGEGIPIHGDGNILFNIDEFISHLKELRLVVSERLTHQKLDTLVDKLKATGPDARLDSGISLELRTAISSIREALEAEIKGVGAYTPTQND